MKPGQNCIGREEEKENHHLLVIITGQELCRRHFTSHRDLFEWWGNRDLVVVRNVHHMTQIENTRTETSAQFSLFPTPRIFHSTRLPPQESGVRPPQRPFWIWRQRWSNVSPRTQISKGPTLPKGHWWWPQGPQQRMRPQTAFQGEWTATASVSQWQSATGKTGTRGEPFPSTTYESWTTTYHIQTLILLPLKHRWMLSLDPFLAGPLW